MPSREHHSQSEYACPTVVYAVLTTAGHPGALMPFCMTTEAEQAYERAANVAGVVVSLPVIRCFLPGVKEWTA